MKLSVRTEDLRSAMKKTRLTVSPNDTNPVLQNFAIRAENGALVLVATNLQLATVAVVPATVDVSGTTTLPGMKLLSIIEHASSDVIELQVDTARGQAQLIAGDFIAQLATLPFDDFPRLEEFLDDQKSKTDRVLLADNLDRISFSVSTNEARRNLLMVYLNDGLMQASDGSISTVIEFDKSFQKLLIPALAVKDLIKVLRASEVQEVELCSSANFLLFRLGQDLFMTRLSAGNFPDLPGKIIKPTEKNDIKLKVERAKLRAAINRVGVTASDKTLATCFEVKPKDTGHTLVLSSSDMLGNNSSEEISAEFSGAESLRVFFEYTRVLDILNALKQDTIEFRFHTNRRVPVRIEEDNPRFMCFMQRLSEQVIAQPTAAAATAEGIQSADEL